MDGMGRVPGDTAPLLSTSVGTVMGMARASCSGLCSGTKGVLVLDLGS